jgi:multiple sugar transport system permease protein
LKKLENMKRRFSKQNIAVNLVLIRKNRKLYLALLPFFSIFFVFTVLPVIIAIYYSFTSYNVIQPPKWIGLDNYINLFVNDPIFIKAVINTFVFAIFTGPIGFLVSLLLAWMINDFRPSVRALLTVFFYAPSISGQLYLIWQLIFSNDSHGFANSFLISSSIINEPINWLTDPKYMMTVVIIVALWMSLGTGFLSFIAGLQGVDKTLYEAGSIDGINNRYQELWFITLPSIKPQLMFAAVMSTTAAFASADIMMNLCGFPSTDYAAHTIVTHLQDYGNIRFEMGYACAIAVILFALMIFINKYVQRALRKVGN